MKINKVLTSCHSAIDQVWTSWFFGSWIAPASFPVVLGDFGCDVTRQAFGSKPPLVTRIARTGLGTRLATAVIK